VEFAGFYGKSAEELGKLLDSLGLEWPAPTYPITEAF